MSEVELPPRVIRDDDFYLQYAIFQVEHRLFKVAILNFTQESEVFAAMFQLPQDTDSIVDGKTDRQPIMLEGVTTEDFKPLLRVMYARAFTEEEVLTEKEWVSVLVLAARWAMERLHQLAIKKLGPLISTDPYKLVVMGLEHNVSAWLVSGVYVLVRRQDPMGEDDVSNIGISTVLKVSTIREWIWQWKAEKYDIAPKGKVVSKIKEIFGPAVDA